MTRVLTADDRQAVKAAIDRAQRASVAAHGGHNIVERTANDLTRLANRTADAGLQEALDEALAKVAFLQVQNEELHAIVRQLTDELRRHRVHVRGNWWHPEARRLRGLGMSYPAIGRRFGVHHTTVMNACRALPNKRPRRP